MLVFLSNLGSPPLLFFFLGCIAVLVRSDELSGGSSNSLVLIACDNQALVSAMLEAVRTLLSRCGGVCLVSDAQWLRH